MLIDHLNDHYKARVPAVVAKLRSAVDAGVVPNVLFNEAKDTINRAIDQGVENFLATGPHAQNHHQSDWWLLAYHADALHVSAHRLDTVIRRTMKIRGLNEYVTFLHSMVEYATLLDKARPLIRKRGELPKVKTAKQIEREADCMTCQCCGRGIFAQTGTIAHHGYERPGTGWQTASCMGAKHLPFEVSRDRLGDLIERLKQDIAAAHKHRKEVIEEKTQIPFFFQTYVKAESRYGSGRYENHTQHFWRSEFDVLVADINSKMTANNKTVLTPLAAAIWAKIEPRSWQKGWTALSFNDLKEDEIERTSGRIHSLNAFLQECKKRYEGWKQTHTHFDKQTHTWIAVAV